MLGTNAAGTAAAGNTGAAGNGVRITGSNNLVGGATSADRNVISGNAAAGVYVAGGSGNTLPDFRTFNPIPPARDFPINDLAASGTTLFARRQRLAGCADGAAEAQPRSTLGDSSRARPKAL